MAGQIAVRRLKAQRLIGEPFRSPVDAVRWMGAVQSQDYAGGKWALGLRGGATAAAVDRLFDDGAILRTHVLRPTWHFVVPGDVRWLLDLTGPRIRAGLAGRYRDLELDDKVVTRALAAFAAAMRDGRDLTRVELGEVLTAARISPAGQRLPHLIMRAELEALIVSGPRRGKQFTYALLEDRVPKARTVDRKEAVAELTHRYFVSHGPAQIPDFTWWSGLTMADARMGIGLAGVALEHEVFEGKDYWFGAGPRSAPRVTGAAHLLPNFDEYAVGYRDRSAMIDAGRPIRLEIFSLSSLLSSSVIVDGLVRGAWRRVPAKTGVRIEVRVMDRLNAGDVAAVEAACRLLGRHIEEPADVVWMKDA
jgi:winged helix DNA-binding protein